MSLLFWIAAALLAGGACALIVAGARASSRADEPGDPVLAVHRRQLEEIAALEERGAFDAPEAERARVEAARRLLASADRRRVAWRAPGRRQRIALLAAAAAAPLAALAVYVLIGAPGAADEPYDARVQAWRGADPGTLTAPQVAAVLEQAARARPDDLQAVLFLGQARLASGDAYGALRAFRRAAELAPEDARPWEGLGESFVTIAEGRVDDDARRAFAEALRRDPASVIARYQAGRAQLAAGDRAGAATSWRDAAALLPRADPRRAALIAEADALSGDGRASVQAAADPAIRAMVDGLAARLEREPDDVQGWARLVRSYGVLGDAAAQARALEQARRRFADRPDALALVEREAAAR